MLVSMLLTFVQVESPRIFQLVFLTISTSGPRSLATALMRLKKCLPITASGLAEQRV